jgi:hypothetical protein
VRKLVDISAKEKINFFSKDSKEQAFFEEILHHSQLCKIYAEKFTKRDDLMKMVS